jgi:hypothetical protein
LVLTFGLYFWKLNPCSNGVIIPVSQNFKDNLESVGPSYLLVCFEKLPKMKVSGDGTVKLGMTQIDNEIVSEWILYTSCMK